MTDALARLMHRAHAFGAENPLAAFFGRPEPIEAYYDTRSNLPVATPLTRKDCSPICDGAAAVVLTARPQAVRVAGLGSATETASILDRSSLTTLDATRQAARIAYWRAGIASPRELAGLVVEVHDAFNSLLPIGLADLGLVDAEASLEALVGDPGARADLALRQPDHRSGRAPPHQSLGRAQGARPSGRRHGAVPDRGELPPAHRSLPESRGPGAAMPGSRSRTRSAGRATTTS